jgi:hypothetical protein
MVFFNLNPGLGSGLVVSFRLLKILFSDDFRCMGVIELVSDERLGEGEKWMNDVPAITAAASFSRSDILRDKSLLISVSCAFLVLSMIISCSTSSLTDSSDFISCRKWFLSCWSDSTSVDTIDFSTFRLKKR